jgi:MoxR-like ATPase
MSYSICLKGFSPNESGHVAKLVSQGGHRVVRSVDSAQLIVTGPDARREVYQIAQHRGVGLMPWEDFRRKHLAPAVSTGEEHPAPLAAQEPTPLMEEKDGKLRILDLWLDRPLPQDGSFRGLIPHADRFRHLCFDQPFVDTVRAACLGALHDYPVALEGETSASKTTAVQWLAHCLDQPVLRHNLHGQSDSGELIARYAPGNVTDGLDMATLLEHAAHFSEPSRETVERAKAGGRNLTPLEMQILAGREHLAATNWALQLGSLPKALGHGLWLLLDEVNLAEPQVLERLNATLEKPRGLVLTEGDGRIYGPGGDVPVHPQFRIFATMNPAEYAGRSVLSAAFRDRWTLWQQAATPGEAEYLAMVRFLSTGHHPVVHCNGVDYRAEATAPLYGTLTELPDWESMARQLALFQTSVAKAAGTEGGPPSLGRTRRERYSFTRRTLLSTLEFVHRQIEAGAEARPQLLRDAIQIFYVNRLRDVADRNAVLALLRAAGL